LPTSGSQVVSEIVDRHRRIHEGAVLVSMSDSQLGKLARRAAYGILMAFGTGSAIVDRAQSAVDIVQGLVNLLI
jgi:hypothetical protein